MNASAAFQYDAAFAGNIGLLTPHEQSLLRQATVAIPGMGGVGGAYLLTLARLGVGRFIIADRDVFELRNLHRQVGATLATMHRPKTDVMAEMATAINPELAIRILHDEIHAGNIDEFLTGADVVLDGLDFFRIDARRLLFQRARAHQLTAITCGPMGFSAALLVFTPSSPSFDRFFDLRDDLSETEQLLRFAVGLAPAALHVPYIDRRSVSVKEHRGPASMIAIQLCAALGAMETVNVIVKRRPPHAVPRYAQFDAYRLRYRRGTLWFGNRHPWQQAKLWYLKRLLAHDVIA